MNKNFYKTLLIKLVVIIIFLGIIQCSDEDTPSLYDNSEKTSAAPEIISVEPASEAVSAVTVVKITGKNFLADTSQVKVYFGKKAGKILSSSSNEIQVIPPNISGQMKIKIATQTALSFSNEYDYLLTPAAEAIYPPSDDKTSQPFNIILDSQENVYSYNTGVGVMKIEPNGNSSLYSAKSGETFWTCMRFGAGGVLYGVRGLQAVFSIPAGGGVKNSSWAVLTPSTVKLSKIEFDSEGNLWAAGKNSLIYKIKPDKTYLSFPFNYTVTAMRIFKIDDTFYMYAAVQSDVSTKIIRFPIINGEPGSVEDYFDFAAAYGDNFVVNDMTFAEDGTLYLATDLPSPIVYVNPDKSHGYLYKGILLESPALSLAWGNGNYMYYVRAQIKDNAGNVKVLPTILKLNMLKKGAPYYGM